MEELEVIVSPIELTIPNVKEVLYEQAAFVKYEMDVYMPALRLLSENNGD